MRYLILLTVLLALVSCDNAHTPLNGVINEIVDDDPPTSIDDPGDKVIIIPSPLSDPITGLPTSGAKIIRDSDLEQEADPIEEPEGIAIMAIVVVINANSHDLHVRDPAGLHLGEGNILGHMPNGTKGRVIDGPKNVSGLIWWEIEWLSGDCEIKKRVPCVGWSAEFDTDGTRLLELAQ